MSRPKKAGRRCKGIQAKRGLLYVVLSKSVVEDGKKRFFPQWIPTGLEDTKPNIKKAIEFRNSILKIDNSSVYIDPNVTFEELLSYYLQKKKRELADTTYASYEYKSRHILNYFREIKVKYITEAHVKDFLDSLFIKNNLQKRTVKDIRSIFSNIMEYAISSDIIDYNPVKNVMLNKELADEHSGKIIHDDDFFTYEQALLFLKQAKALKKELYELFCFTFWFGLRREEVLGLRWSAIDFNNHTMRIEHTVTKGTKIVYKNSTKTSSSAREYPLGDQQLDMLNNLKQKEERGRRLCGRDYIENDYVFKYETGALYYPDFPSKVFKKILAKTPELPQDVTFHGLRKSCVSMLVHNGYDIKSIQRWAGHADINTTLKIYAKVKDRESKQEILNGINRLIQLEADD